MADTILRDFRLMLEMQKSVTEKHLEDLQVYHEVDPKYQMVLQKLIFEAKKRLADINQGLSEIYEIKKLLTIHQP